MFQMLHFSPALYNHVINDLGKHAILILNKVDMVPPELVIAWKEHFLLKYPKLHIACFTSYPKEAITNIVPGKGKCSSFYDILISWIRQILFVLRTH